MNNNITEYKSLSDFIKKDNVITIKTVNNKKQLFSKISNLLEHETNFSHSSLSKILLKNENKKPTNIGSGVAIPNMQHNQIKNTNGCFIRLYNSIIYDSFNNDPVDLIFALLSPVESSNRIVGVVPVFIQRSAVFSVPGILPVELSYILMYADSPGFA